MSDDEMPAALRAWHEVVRTRDAGLLPALLADDVVFRSPAMHTPQHGRDAALVYLRGAVAVLGPTLRYEREWVDADGAVLEFRADLDEVRVHGVDLLRWDDAGRITEFTVMVRPVKALHRLIERMAPHVGGPGSAPAR